MCLAKPLKLIKVEPDASTGIVEIENGTLTVGLDLVPEACEGTYVLVHAGMAIDILTDEDAQAILDSYKHYVSIKDKLTPEVKP